MVPDVSVNSGHQNKVHRPKGLNNTALEAGSPRSRGPQVWFLLDLLMAIFSLCPHTAFALCELIPNVSSSSYRDASPNR